MIERINTEEEPLEICLATTEDDFAQIRKLNYQTFVDEIPQHEANRLEALTDRFERESQFIICRHEQRIVGMVALRAHRPFSLDQKLENLDDYLPDHRAPCEVRLLAIDPQYRHTSLMAKLFQETCEYCFIRGHDLLCISGTLRQQPLYTHMGFVPFGPVVGTQEAAFQPMWLNLERLVQQAQHRNSGLLRAGVQRPRNFLPGPVDLPDSTHAALGGQSISHRSERFFQLAQHTQRLLCEMTGADRVALITGSGTTANDVVAGQLAQIEGRGLILVNGEFGQRLVEHATQLQLAFDEFHAPWGKGFDLATLEETLQSTPVQWIWAVHAETSTGVLNDIETLKHISLRQHAVLALDCVSSLGVVPCELDGVAFAASGSGKGLCSLAGIALVFSSGALPPPRKPLPRSLDLRLWDQGHLPFTIASRTVAALTCSLESLSGGDRIKRIETVARSLRKALEDRGIAVLAKVEDQFHGILTIPLNQQQDSYRIGRALEEQGWWISYQSEYLLRQNWFQISLMGSENPDLAMELPDTLQRLLSPNS